MVLLTKDLLNSEVKYFFLIKYMINNAIIDFNLEHARYQTFEICLMAVQHNGLNLKFVKNQTPELCLAAVQQKGIALKYVENQTPEICIAAYRQNQEAAKYFDPDVMSEDRIRFSRVKSARK